MALFESYERRIDKINEVLNSYGIASLEEAEKITKDAGLDVYTCYIRQRPRFLILIEIVFICNLIYINKTR